jgi:hypothetical protein
VGRRPGVARLEGAIGPTPGGRWERMPIISPRVVMFCPRISHHPRNPGQNRYLEGRLRGSVWEKRRTADWLVDSRVAQRTAGCWPVDWM